jgi:hypothetical protein
MKKILSALSAGALSIAMAATSLMPAQAAPVYVPNAPQTTNRNADVVQVNGQDWRWKNRGGFNGRYGGRDMGLSGPRTDYGNNGRYERRGWNRGGRHGWNRDYGRRHWRGDNLGGAVIGGLITGAIVGGVLNNSGERVYRGGNAHVQWCYDRYRTYRASDNTYVPRVGYRAYCNSPYN